MTHLAFAVDGGGGNLTYQQNLAAALAAVPEVHSDFLPIRIDDADIWGLVPLVRSNLALSASARAAAALHAVHRRQPVDAGFIHSQSLALFSVPFMHQVPTVISTDGTPANFDTFADGLNHKVYGRTIEGLKKIWTRATFTAARHVLGFSDWVKQSLVNDYGCDPAKVDVIPSGVDVERWRPAPELRPNDGTVRILFTGGNFDLKGGPELLRWLRETRHRSVELHLVTKQQLPELAGVVIHNDLQPNAPALIALAQRCDLFALPTHGDCFPFAIIEAQAAGLPVVATRVGGIGEIVEDGATGFLFERGDVAGLFDRLDRLVADEGLRARMSIAARTHALRRFDSRINSRRVLDRMLQVANDG